MRIPKKERQARLLQEFSEDPFLTDEHMAAKWGVSIQTIRLDRMELGIPELRVRIKRMAEHQVRSLSPEEVIGDVVDLQLDQSGISIFDIKEDDVFARNRIARGHHLFAQANSLAVAIVDGEVVLTRSANIRFLRPVHQGERCIAHAKVTEQRDARFRIQVKTRVQQEVVFQGHFDVYRFEEEKRT